MKSILHVITWTVVILGTIINIAFYQIPGAELKDYTIMRVIDGDTIEFQADFLPSELGKSLKLRVLGVDTPERGQWARCSKERDMAQISKSFTEKQIRDSKQQQIELKSWDKYGGRVLGDVILDGTKLSSKLISSGYAKPYTGSGPKHNWCK